MPLDWQVGKRVSHTAHPHRYGLCHGAGAGSDAGRAMNVDSGPALSSSENSGGNVDFSYPVYMDLEGGLRLCPYGVTCTSTQKCCPEIEFIYLLFATANTF